MVNNLLCIINVFASSDNGIFDTLNASSPTFLDRVVTAFDKSIFPLTILFLLISIDFFGTNENLFRALKSAIKWLLIIFIVLNCINIITNTFLWVVNLLQGTGA